MKALVWPVATYGCESWTLRKNEETRLGTFEMKGLRKILWVSWTAKKTNERVSNKARVKRELLDTVKARNLTYCGHTTRKQGSCVDKEIMQGTMPCSAVVHEGEEDHARPGWTTSRRGQDSPWKSQSEWQRTGINGESTSMVWPTLGSRTAKEQNRTERSSRLAVGLRVVAHLSLKPHRPTDSLPVLRHTRSRFSKKAWNFDTTIELSVLFQCLLPFPALVNYKLIFIFREGPCLTSCSAPAFGALVFETPNHFK